MRLFMHRFRSFFLDKRGSPLGNKMINSRSDMPGQTLADLLREEIGREGPVTFARYMELALYHPVHGYYATTAERTGRSGDFYTSVSVGPVFGRLLAVWLADLFETMEHPPVFTVAEQGSAQGHLAADIMDGLRRDFPAVFERTCYVIVEPLPLLEKTQRQTLSAHADRVRWVSHVQDLEPIAGCFLSNELVDAFPVHKVRRTSGGWVEQRVTTAGDGFAYIDAPTEGLDLSALPEDAPEGYSTELNPAARLWMNAVASRLHRGALLTIDYGFPREELYAPHRSTGTLRGFQQHRRIDEPLEAEPGTCDITAHVDFTALAEEAEHHGLELAAFCDQHHLLVQLLQRLVEHTHSEACLSPAERRGFATLMHPESMGTQFKAIAFTRGITGPSILGPIRRLPL